MAFTCGVHYRPKRTVPGSELAEHNNRTLLIEAEAAQKWPIVKQLYIRPEHGAGWDSH